MNTKAFKMILPMLLMCIFVSAGCGKQKSADFCKVGQIGEVPDEFRSVVENNLFKDVTAFEGRLLKGEVCSEDKESKTVTQKVTMFDTYGRELSSYTFSSQDAYHITTLTATSDGGFLFVLGFYDYAYGQNSWASDEGYASRVIKCDRDGRLEFDTPFEGLDANALEYCFEKDGRFFFFGEIETPETKRTGVHSPTDVYAAILGSDGELQKSRLIAGSDYDSLSEGRLLGNLFVLSVSSQSEDGDFTGSGSKGSPADWTITLDGELEITEKKKGRTKDPFDLRIGEKGGEPIYQSNEMFGDHDLKNPTVFIDYGEFYLTVAENITGVYKNTPPWISSVWYYTETVYTAYDHSGKMLFRASVDSSPDYESAVRDMNNGTAAAR